MNDNLVNLFIVGAAKCGTTSIYEYLAQHPEIYMCPVKEPHFFSSKVENRKKDLYLLPEPQKKYHTKIIKNSTVYDSLFAGSETFKVRGEASPSYLWDPDTASKLYEYNPNARIIIILRHPIERLISAYQMDYSSGRQQSKEFLKTIVADYKRNNKSWGLNGLYLDLGLYYQQIIKYSRLFPADQLLILKFNDFKNNPSQELLKILEFVKVDKKHLENIDFNKVHNESVSIKYTFIKKLNRTKLIRSILKVFGNNLDFLKKITHRKGYGLKITLDNETKNYLDSFYKDDLAALKKDFDIEL